MSKLEERSNESHMGPPQDDSSAETETRSAKRDEPISYVSHNFASMNRAIDNQIQKQELMSVIYRSQRYENSTRTVFYVVSTLSIAALTAVLIWWLLNPGGPTFTAIAPVQGDVLALQSLSDTESVSGAEGGFIDTSFTVFHRNLTPSGDYVVTGKTYASDNLNLPYEQYCYLESADANGELSAKPLASYDGGDFKAETSEAIFINLAEQYCRFSS